MNKRSRKIDVVIVGSIGLDDIETPFEKRTGLLGGSLSYACPSASFFAGSGMVGVVGDDFPEKYMSLYESFGIDLDGLKKADGKTFRWSGVYDKDMINRRTIFTELNVFGSFVPDLPDSYRSAPFIMLGNISPSLQLHVLSQATRPKFVAADTMDLWINTARKDLDRVVASVDMLTLNDSEARLLTGKHNLKQCTESIMKMGPRYVVIKKGEHGAMLACRTGLFLLPAYPVDAVLDPTGAGDSFAGAFMGRLAEIRKVSDRTIREALMYGSVVASFCVEGFSVDGLRRLKRNDIERRMTALRKMMG